MYTFQRKPKKYEQGPRKYSHKRREPNGPEHARENFFAGHCKKVFQRALAFLRRARENKLRARHRPLFFWKLIVLQRTHTHPPDNRRRQLVRGRFGELRGGGGTHTRSPPRRAVAWPAATAKCTRATVGALYLNGPGAPSTSPYSHNFLCSPSVYPFCDAYALVMSWSGSFCRRSRASLPCSSMALVNSAVRISSLPRATIS